MFSICLCLKKFTIFEKLSPQDFFKKGRGKITLNRISSVEHTSLVVARILLSFVSGTCTYRLVLPHFSFHDCTALVTPGVALVDTRPRNVPRAGMRGTVIAWKLETTPFGRRGTDVKGTRRDGYPSLLILSLPLSSCSLAAQPCRPRNVPIFRGET